MRFFIVRYDSVKNPLYKIRYTTVLVKYEKRSVCMKVAFWNGISKTDSIANYVAAIGMTLAVECNCNVILGSNYISNRMPQDCFSGKMLEDRKSVV